MTEFALLCVAIAIWFSGSAISDSLDDVAEAITKLSEVDPEGCDHD